MNLEGPPERDVALRRPFPFGWWTDQVTRHAWRQAPRPDSPYRMPRRKPTPAAPRPPAPEQLEFFPEAVLVEPLDPRETVGGQSRVRGVYRVRFEREAAPHRVFDDRHGWYCDEHGPACRAVLVARGHAETPDS